MQADLVQQQSLSGLFMMIAVLRVNRVKHQRATHFDAVLLEFEAMHQIYDRGQQWFDWTSACDETLMWGTFHSLIDAGLLCHVHSR